eukprot:scaffold56364_cov52-Attheya_sp.AAC.2
MYKSETDEAFKPLHLSSLKSAHEEVASAQTVLTAVRNSLAALLNPQQNGPITDDLGEEYLDLSQCGAINDQNEISKVVSRRELWDNDGPYPQLRGRQVIFSFARPLLEEALSALQRGANVVLITGTPGIGKSSLRNVHAHFLLSKARKEGNRCSVLFAKSEKDTMIGLHLEANGSQRLELVQRSCDWVQFGYPGFKRGHDLFILADVSGGTIKGMSGPGLIIYSSPNQDLSNTQIMKEKSRRLGYPLLTKDQICRYTNDRMNLMFERYGGLPRLVWGDTDDEYSHLSRLGEKLKDVDGFLAELGMENYLKGPHRYFYMKLQEDSAGNPLYNLDRDPPAVVPAPRYVIRMVAKIVVAKLLEPSLEANFGKLHRAVDGILFEEVCLYLIEHHPNNIEFQDFKARKDVDSAGFVSALDGSDTPFLVVPKVSNFPGLDAVLALGNPTSRNGVETPAVAIDLQMTRSMVHSVADEGVDILNDIDARMSSNHNPATKHCLLFLVPEYHFAGFKRQTAKSDARQEELDKLTQYVGCIKLTR